MNPRNNLATIARVVKLIPDEDQHILNLAVEDARRLLLSDDPRDVLQIASSPRESGSRGLFRSFGSTRVATSIDCEVARAC